MNSINFRYFDRRRPDTPTTYAALVLMLVMAGLDQTILSTALSSITAALQGGDLASWVFSAYLLASTAVISLYGKLADRFGVRPLLLFAIGMFMLGSLACAAAVNMPALIGGRALQGLGGGGLLTLTMLAVSTLYPPDESPRRMGMLGTAYGIATLAGPLVGGVLLEGLAWPWVFLIQLPGTLVAFVVLSRSVFAPPQPAPHRLDLVGAALLAAALISLLLAIRSVGAAGPATSARVGPSIAAAVTGLLLLAWALVEWRADDPIVPLALFRNRAYAAVAALSVLSGFALFTAVVYLPIYLQQGLGMGALASAWHTLPLMLGITVGGQVAGRALRHGQMPRRLAIFGSAALVSGFLMLGVTLLRAHLHDWALSAAVFPVGFGLGLLFPLVSVQARRCAPATHAGSATATPVMLRALGGALGVAWMGEILRRHMAHATLAGSLSRSDEVQALAQGVGMLCTWAALAGVLALLVACLLPAARPAGA